MVTRNLIQPKIYHHPHICFVQSNCVLKRIIVNVENINHGNVSNLKITIGNEQTYTIDNAELKSGKPIIFEIMKYYEHGESIYADLDGKTETGIIEILVEWEKIQ